MSKANAKGKNKPRYNLPANQRGIKGFLHEVKRNRIMFLMILPVILFTIVFSYLPMGGIVLAFKKFNYTDGILGSPWVGWSNFKFLVSGGILWRITRNTVLYNIAFMVIDMAAQIAVAIMLNEIGKKWFKKLSQSYLYNPSVMVFSVMNTA